MLSGATCGCSSHGGEDGRWRELSGALDIGGQRRLLTIGLGGKRLGAHSDYEGMLDEVGDGQEPTNFTDMAGGPEVEEGIVGGVVVKPGLRGSSRRCFAPLRSYWSRWLG